MDLFNKITISHFIWYLMPGLGLLVFLFFPFIVFDPEATKNFFESIGPVGIIIFGIVFGFMLEGTRFYRCRWNYHKHRKEFFGKLQTALSTDLNPYFLQSHISDVAKKKDYTGLSLSHAIWIMLGHFTVLAFIESLFWFSATLFFWIIATPFVSVHFNYCVTSSYDMLGHSLNRETAIGLCAIFSVLFFALCWRFNRVSTEEQITTNDKYLEFAKQHREEIRSFLNLKAEEMK